MLEIVHTGPGLALQDAGRVGWRRFGVPQGGAMDRYAMRWANRLMDNPPDAPVLEITLLGSRIRVLEDTWLALAGADHCSGLPAWTAACVEAGTVLAFDQPGRGIFSYLSAPGGFHASRWFGSVSVDSRIGIGDALTQGGQIMAASATPPVDPAVARRSLLPDERRAYAPKEYFSLLPGPQFEAFTKTAREQLVAAEWQVSARSDRTGFRLEGPALEVPESIPSEPVLPGSFQVPGNGQPIVTMIDGPTVGGYPKIAVLRDSDRDRLAQCAPGTQLCFQWIESY